MITLASTPGPMWLRVMEEQQNAPPPEPSDPIWAYVAGTLALCLLISWGFWAIWRRQRIDPHELAFRRLARRLGLSASERSAVRQLAKIHGEATPAALVLSPSAVRVASEKLRRADASSPLIERAAILAQT